MAPSENGTEFVVIYMIKIKRKSGNYHKYNDFYIQKSSTNVNLPQIRF